MRSIRRSTRPSPAILSATREAQVAWDELYPFADRRALQTARRLCLGGDARALARLVNDDAREFRMPGYRVRTDWARA